MSEARLFVLCASAHGCVDVAAVPFKAESVCEVVVADE